MQTLASWLSACSAGSLQGSFFKIECINTEYTCSSHAPSYCCHVFIQYKDIIVYNPIDNPIDTVIVESEKETHVVLEKGTDLNCGTALLQYQLFHCDDNCYNDNPEKEDRCFVCSAFTCEISSKMWG